MRSSTVFTFVPTWVLVSRVCLSAFALSVGASLALQFRRVSMGLTVNHQPSTSQKINRQPSKTEYFYRQPSDERAKINRQVSFLIYFLHILFPFITLS